ncbi:uncharacterized protein EV420DRAFT_250032 [Desarmillaria tabescens]|uniref:HNH nuclease domain-containing protein n=1 Tax=Armillaria tabescens TaxID=1929756 RepID=A0AA39N6L8_ARMTA|nr:uncharacterized protein EV420DRAFT_250032 [Desarmillaria tabescens]KAK0460081.1 hypothetical protein EV420DRAFT_250032 [Desarmillaria tabescens]
MRSYSSEWTEGYCIHYTSDSEIPIEAICWSEEKIDQEQMPSAEDIARFMDNPDHTTDYLVTEARELIKGCDDGPIWLSGLGSSVVSILSAMLDCAPSERGLRYISSSICASKSLNQLALVWFAHFLWPFKVLNRYSVLLDSKTKWSQHCDLRQQVLLRQDYRCALTGFTQLGHTKGRPLCNLQITRILQRSIMGSEKTDFLGTIAREMVKNYVDPTVDLDADGLHNFITFQYDTSVYFNYFMFSLKATSNAGEYAVETYGEREWFFPFKDVIVFEVDTPPDPRYLRLHACVADVLHQSGAGKVMNKILFCLYERTGAVRIADIIDLQGMLDTLALRYSLITALKLP